MNTKEKRIQYRNLMIESDIKNGFIREDFKGAIILINRTPNNQGKTYVKHYTGTRRNHDKYFSFSSVERLEDYLIRLKKDLTSREEWSEKRKKEGKKMSESARAAKAIKEELKELFPNIKFSVKSDNFSMGNSVHVSWVNGPTTKKVDEIIKKYQYGSFNGMEDIYEYTNKREDIPQAKYVSSKREISEDLKEMFQEIYEEPTNAPYNEANRAEWNFFQNTDIPSGAENLSIIKNDSFSCGHSWEFYKLSYTLSEAAKKTVKKEVPNIEKVEVVKGKIDIIEYSSKSIAVIGDTKPIKDKLKALNGRFNFRLSCGPGWIFPLTKLEEVKKALTPEKSIKNERNLNFFQLPQLA